MKTKSFILALLLMTVQSMLAQQRRPIDNEHPLWLVHIDVWNKADPQKIIDLIPAEIKPYVCMNLSLSCQYDTNKNVYKMPQQAVRTYKSWATVCQKNGLWFTCQPASGGHTHIQDDDLETFEYFFKRYPNFLGWNYAEQFWGFDEAGDKSSSNQASRIALFAKLVPMHHKYGGVLTISFCGNIWSHPLNPMGMMKRNKDLLNACKDYPEAILWLYKYTTSSCFYNNESVTFGPFVSGLAKNYGVRYDNCGWNGAMNALFGENNGKKYPVAAGIGTVMEQTAINGGAVWDGPELIWTEDFQNLSDTNISGYTRRNWGVFPGFKNIWLDMFGKVIDGTLHIPTRQEVIDRTKIVVINDVNSSSANNADEEKYAAWGNLYDGLYKQDDPFNRGNGQWMDNFCYLKKTGRYATIPLVIGLYDDLAKSIPVQMKKSARNSRWSTQAKKVKEFNEQYPEVSSGDLFVARTANQIVAYTPYTYLNSKTTADAGIPLKYNTCDSLYLSFNKLSSGLFREYADHIDFYLNNYRTDSTAQRIDRIVITGVTAEPSFTMKKRADAKSTATPSWDAATGIYTLSVKHLGPVDLTINCAGAAQRTDVAAEATHLPEPKQPEKYVGPIIIEAEDMDYKSIKSCVTDPYGWYPSVRGHAGNGFADMGTNTAGALKHQLELDEAGDYDIAVRYTSTQKAGKLVATVNGKKQDVPCEKTGTNEWRKATISTTLKAGKNTLIITNTGGLNMYIDQIIYTPAGTPAEKFLVTIRDAEHGKVTANVDEAAEGETVTLSVAPDQNYRLKELRVVNSVYYTLEQTIAVTDDETVTFTMPDDNVTLVPLFVDKTAVYKLDFSDVLAGTVPPGWRCVQENNTVHEYPNKYDNGARTFAGFGGYQGKALYWREGCAEYGRQSAYPLTLEAGKYTLTYAMAAWKQTPRYKVSVVDAVSGNAIATSEVWQAAPNANGNGAANLTSAKEHVLEFTVSQPGKYVISFTNETNANGYEEYLLLDCRLNIVETLDAIAGVQGNHEGIRLVYDLQGRRVASTDLGRGVRIVRNADGTTRKVLRR